MTRTPILPLLAALGLLWAAAAAASDDARPASAPSVARKTLPHGKWPWFRKYRKGAAEPAAQAAPEAPPGASPTASAERVSDLQPPAPPPDAAPAAPAAPAVPSVPRAAALPTPTPAPAVPAPHETAPAPAQAAWAGPPTPSRTMRSFSARVRRELRIPSSWRGAPAVRELTASATTIRALEPLQDRLGALVASPASEAAARADFAAALIQRGLDEAAAAECLAALELDPTLAPAWNNLTTALRRSGRMALATHAVEEAMRLEPHAGLPHFNLAMLLDLQGRPKDADAHYMRALQLEPRLWLPQENPLVIGNERATRTLHRLYMAEQRYGGVVLDTTSR